MAIARVKQVGTYSGNFQASYTFALGAAVAQGNTLLLSLMLNTSTTTVTSVTDSQGNTYTVDRTQGESSNNEAGVIASGYVATALGAADTITVNLSATEGCSLVLEEFSGIATSGRLDQTTSQATGFGTSHTSGQVTTTQPDELLFGTHAFSSGLSWTPSGSWNETFDAAVNSRRHVTQYQIVAATGAYESDGTTSGSDNTASLIATYKGAAAAGATFLPARRRGH